MTDTKVVAIIPARGGSKGIPKKNLVDFCGKPLLAWSILQAKGARTISEVYVSSDDDQILATAQQFGALPIKRPAALAGDHSTSEEALRHALDVITRTDAAPALVVFLQATSPLRSPKDIEVAVARLREEGADSLFSMALLEDFCIWTKEGGRFKGLTYDPANRGRRQEREPLYLENGSIYIFRPEILIKYGNRLGGKIAMYDMPFWKSYEIDKLEDFEICEYYFKKYLFDLSGVSEQIDKIPIARIDLIVYDFDGVMTDNRVIVMQDGTEAVLANRADGLGVESLAARGIRQMILSTETNLVVKARAAKLGLEVIQGCKEKRPALESYCKNAGISLSRVVYLGNDVNDLEAMQAVGYPIAPSDAHPAVKAVAKLVTAAPGGGGVIKELAERLIAAS